MDKTMKNTSDIQRKILKQFKLNLEDVLNERHTDELLIKFLRAKNFNLKAAEKIFRANYFNRLMFKVNNMLDWYEKPEVAKNYETLGFLGFAKDGSLIQYMEAGKLDFYGFIMSMSASDLCWYFSYIMEYAAELIKKENLRTGRNVNEVTYIIDLEGFSIHRVLHKCVMEMGLDFIGLLQDCYPEIWSMALVVNAPTIFDKAFSLFKPVLRKNVIDKLKVVRKENTKQVLLKYIDEDVLPVFLGGKRVDSNGDPKCKEFIKFARDIPEKFYAINRSTILSPADPGVKEIIIGPRSVYNYVTVCKEGGDLVKYEHRAENGSISITLMYRECDPDADGIKLPSADEYLDENDENCKYKPISVTLRIQTHLVPDDMTVDYPWPGIYVIRYDNTGSWFTSRKIILRFTRLSRETQLSSQ